MVDAASRGFELGPALTAELEGVLPRMAERTVAAIIAEVPAYTDPFRGRMGANIENAVQASLGAFLRLATRGGDSASDPTVAAVVDGAYELGRGEARDGRSIDALLAAYRVGARVAWRELSAKLVAADLPTQIVARFAELVFAYIDELSAASVSGHTDELATAGRVRQRQLDVLARQLLRGEDPEALRISADNAAWTAPETLTAVLVPAAQIARVTTGLNPATLPVAEELPGLDPSESWAVALVPDADGARRTALLAALAGRTAIVGPSRPWMSVRSSYLRALRARGLGTGTVDTDEHLVELVLGADEEAAEDLRRRALAPLTRFPPATAERLAETLRSWLLNQGRRDAVAAELIVHPQTVRYRMTQVREAYGDRLNDPRAILDLTVALGYSAGQPIY